MEQRIWNAYLHFELWVSVLRSLGHLPFYNFQQSLLKNTEKLIIRKRHQNSFSGLHPAHLVPVITSQLQSRTSSIHDTDQQGVSHMTPWSSQLFLFIFMAHFILGSITSQSRAHNFSYFVLFYHFFKGAITPSPTLWDHSQHMGPYAVADFFYTFVLSFSLSYPTFSLEPYLQKHDITSKVLRNVFDIFYFNRDKN